MRGLYLFSVVLHVLAATTWIGGMVMFVTALMPLLRRQEEARRRDLLHEFGRRFRLVSWVCFAILVPTGTFNLWARGVQPGDLLRPEWRSTTFGSLVLIKLSLVFLAVAISVLHEGAIARWHARWLGRLLLVVGIAIVTAAVLLVRAT